MTVADLRIVTPQEAQAFLAERWAPDSWPTADVVAAMHTVATEPDRTRAAVVKALRAWGQTLQAYESSAGYPDFDGGFATGMEQAGDDTVERADAIENGADYA